MKKAVWASIASVIIFIGAISFYWLVIDRPQTVVETPKTTPSSELVVAEQTAVKDCGVDNSINPDGDTRPLICFVRAADACQAAKISVKNDIYGLVAVSLNADCKLTISLPESSVIIDADAKSAGGSSLTCSDARGLLFLSSFSANNVSLTDDHIIQFLGKGNLVSTPFFNMLSENYDCHGTFLDSAYYLEASKKLKEAQDAAE